MKGKKWSFILIVVLQRKIHPAAENFVVNIFPNFLNNIFSFLFQPPTIYCEMASMDNKEPTKPSWAAHKMLYLSHIITNKTKTLIVDHFDLAIFAMVLLSK